MSSQTSEIELQGNLCPSLATDTEYILHFYKVLLLLLSEP